MGEGGGGTCFALSLFGFHLSPFPPETPDTQAILGITVDPREIEDDAYVKVLEVNSIMGNLKLEKKIVPPI